MRSARNAHGKDRLEILAQRRRVFPRTTPLHFWSDTKGEEYFDGCLRDLKQGRCTYHYILTQGERHGIVRHWSEYQHTRVEVDLDVGISARWTLMRS